MVSIHELASQLYELPHHLEPPKKFCIMYSPSSREELLELLNNSNIDNP